MINHLDTQNLVILATAIFIASFFIGSLMNGVLEDDGFGVMGNTCILTAGAFLGFYAMNWFIPYSRDTAMTAIYGVSGAFIALAILAIFKAVLNRAGY